MPSKEQLLNVIHLQTAIVKMGLDLGAVMQYVVEQVPHLIDADGAVIELAEDGFMVYRAASGIVKSQLGLRLSVEGSLSGLCVKENQALFCSDSEVDPRVDRLACQRIGLRSMIVIPLNHAGVTVGVLKAVSKRINKFAKCELDILALLSEVVAAAMYFAVAYDTDSLYFKATHDTMTGLANRALFMDRLREVISRAPRTNSPAGLLMIDIDGLKQVNDIYGHRVGDALILEFARRIRAATREFDTAARLGGDEFGVLLTSLERHEDVDSVVQRIEAEMESPYSFEEFPLDLRASIGTAVIPDDGVEPVKLLELADQRMYRVKRLHKLQPS